MTTHYEKLESPIGELLLLGDEDALTAIRFEDEDGAREVGADWRRGGSALEEAARQLTAYFAGERTEFDLCLAPRGTPFMKRVWKELERIPFGATISYGELARRVGNPNASRAVGAANGKNPIPIVVPCHRVIGADGSLTGFAGGLDIKRRLLRHEGVGIADPAAQTTFLETT